MIRSFGAVLLIATLLAQGTGDPTIEERLEMGKALIERQKYEEAAAEFKEVLKIDPMNGTALFNLGYLYGTHLGDEELREKYWNCYKASSHISLGDVALESGELQEAAAHFRDAMNYLPESAALRERLGALYARMGAWQEALREYETAASLDPENVSLQLALARHLAGKGEWGGAAAHIERAASARPRDANLRRTAFWLYVRSGEREKAVGQLAALCNEGGASAREHCTLGELMLGEGRLEDAGKEFRRGLSDDTRDRCAAGARALAAAYEKRGELEAAASAYAAMLEAGITSPEIYNSLAIIHQKKNRLDAAVSAAERGVAAFPEDAALHNNLGTLYALRMEYERALREYEAAVRLSPGLAEAYLDMGIIYGDYLRNKEKAVEAFGRYVSLKPEGRKLPEVIRYLGAPPGGWKSEEGEKDVPGGEVIQEKPTPRPGRRVMRF